MSEEMAPRARAVTRAPDESIKRLYYYDYDYYITATQYKPSVREKKMPRTGPGVLADQSRWKEGILFLELDC